MLRLRHVTDRLPTKQALRHQKSEPGGQSLKSAQAPLHYSEPGDHFVRIRASNPKSPARGPKAKSPSAWECIEPGAGEGGVNCEMVRAFGSARACLKHSAVLCGLHLLSQLKSCDGFIADLSLIVLVHLKALSCQPLIGKQHSWPDRFTCVQRQVLWL